MTTNINDPIVFMGRYIAQLEARSDELEGKENDARKASNAPGETYFENARLDVHNRICALRDSLSCFEARSLTAALIQLGRAHGLLDDVAEDDKTIALAARAQMERLIMSAIRCIERELGTGLDEMGLTAFRVSHLDPWTPVEERLAAIKAKCESKAV